MRLPKKEVCRTMELLWLTQSTYGGKFTEHARARWKKADPIRQVHMIGKIYEGKLGYKNGFNALIINNKDEPEYLTIAKPIKKSDQKNWSIRKQIEKPLRRSIATKAWKTYKVHSLTMTISRHPSIDVFFSLLIFCHWEHSTSSWK